jgi:CheY-like chemotaxis protein
VTDFAGKVRIVLVEDNPADVVLIQEALSANGLNVDLARFEDGEGALQSLESDGRRVPDLIMLDLNLPKDGGLDVLRRIRAMPEMSGTPIAILTASQSPQDREAVEGIAGTSYIAKPLMLQDFLTTVGGSVKEILARRGNSD